MINRKIRMDRQRYAGGLLCACSRAQGFLLARPKRLTVRPLSAISPMLPAFTSVLPILIVIFLTIVLASSSTPLRATLSASPVRDNFFDGFRRTNQDIRVCVNDERTLRDSV
jgi:hypothetical protein